MNKKTFTIIMGIALLGAFFLPYYRENSTNYSGLDIVLNKNLFYNKYQFLRFVLLLIPISGLLLLGDASQKGPYEKGMFHWLPILTIAFLILFANYAGDHQSASTSQGGASLSDMIIDAIKGSTFGLWITMAAALLLVIANPKPNP